MKKFLLIIALAVTAFSCQDEGREDLMNQPETEKVPDSIQTLTGEFIYAGEAAILRGSDFVYGVTIDSMSKVLAEQVQPFQKEEFDMVAVKVKGKIVTNSRQDGWDENIEIREILEILETEKAAEQQEE
ncbi:hypothetical protein [Salegentibacter mishustinae]|jgi:hypothetical protein|uniref:NlpE C-terminal OB domain-containing protein n=1 Tax=Salegentibacter mishustinae TaxID=270918 RepID=A0A0Q9ZG41_9FLAO|nr:hypothetical protein [Salegentibacter mishustinae]KRG27841.1 hypothetical protein APR42_08805 [Salegentibacter mishustinae]MDX1720294.1 hypothetical protein [Salegentibacter mishustinae]PNW20908.1 hypothetical protein APB85_06430 [Salegentibacter mishustinae]PZX64079.1 hypothetical protein LY54_01939 [Salegentibacter mishustinae]GGW90020.1 hypothetical protein GCM10008086_18730 [Salegentibacter mishustinae]|tara:strand:+ start:132 stop:518 length:387 start_codon:yes stop_codon:yes gene_type:complete